MIKIYEDFLPQELAEELHDEIYKTPDNWWTYAYKYFDKKPVYMQHTLTGLNAKRKLDEAVERSFQEGNFSYKFKRSMKHVDTCKCYECKFNDYLNNEFVEWLKNNTFLENPYKYESFVSIYDRGDFLSSHTDEQRGIAFIFNLTKNWKPEYGGMLHISRDEGIEVVYPKFNSLVIMELGDGGLSHYVSEVSQYATHQRIAISGWFNES
jgi:hypothetical protein